MLPATVAGTKPTVAGSPRTTTTPTSSSLTPLTSYLFPLARYHHQLPCFCPPDPPTPQHHHLPCSQNLTTVPTEHRAPIRTNTGRCQFPPPQPTGTHSRHHLLHRVWRERHHRPPKSFVLILGAHHISYSSHNTTRSPIADFIHATLRKLGIPRWICHVVKGLMSRVKVLPAFSREHTIDISRGVMIKQGCPLSPLLFAICYDVLLTQLDHTTDHTSLAFADDLAAGAARLTLTLS